MNANRKRIAPEPIDAKHKKVRSQLTQVEDRSPVKNYTKDVEAIQKSDLPDDESLYCSRLRLKFNMEKIIQKYEKMEESGVEIDLLTSEIYTRRDADQKKARRAREIFYAINENFGLAPISAPENSRESLDKNDSLISKCEKRDRQFMDILTAYKNGLVNEYLANSNYQRPAIRYEVE